MGNSLREVRGGYSQCDQALPCSSCFFLARASTRRRSEHSSQMVVSEGLPHILHTWSACSGRGSDRRGAVFMLCLPSQPGAEALWCVQAALLVIPTQVRNARLYEYIA